MKIDDIYLLLDDTENMLRGMKMDPLVPRHTKEAIGLRIQIIEEMLEKLEPHLGCII